MPEYAPQEWKDREQLWNAVEEVERSFTAAEFRAAQNEGWEKQYPYKVGKIGRAHV